MSALKPVQEGPLLFEQPFIKVPIEASRKSFRNATRLVDRDLALLSTTAKDLLHKSKTGLVGGLSREQVSAQLDHLTARVRTLKHRVEELQDRSLSPAHGKVRKRIEHVAAIDAFTGVDDPMYKSFSRTRLDRWIVDWALRTGRTETAKAVANAKGIEDLVDIELFSEISAIENSLLSRSCTQALHWCTENRIALKKLRSNLEFDLRLQEFIELIRASKAREAIIYMRKHLVAWESEHRSELEMAMGILASSASGGRSITGPHKRLYDLSRWKVLARTFRQTAYTLSSLSSEPMLYIALYAGLAALKHPACYDRDSRNPDCPVCDVEGFGKLAKEVPFSHHSISTVICRISGQITNGDNPPMAFPNGAVYSQEALEQQAAAVGMGFVTDPKTDAKCEFGELRKVHIL
ncbi:macrophage erythroblast attacher isoform 1 [Dacryopinax primogenitus]|uniref:Macrophage erythroblast attacher isoform 1 n=1 Tax=Dacryopinax primogenitus (strain DJM 731) TaxID=1858805 RepID=M5GC95_DACPD|nr:macrophage erythroblast attacher isoform 1 [Dacryopinax primogenitus]EJU03737.1 macrophage erythroblast attacher isoform 1 [Dacryopinax primogenitus]